jgi:3-deoxy-D-manno-octulosonate 8-phosphate phosphatase (KDO 8-P phosphatase)
MPRKVSKGLLSRLARVRLFLSDVDGILTDATVLMGGDHEVKRFCVTDGLGLKLLRESGIKVGWISGRPSAATELRARELEIDFLHQSRNSKVEAAEEFMAKTGCNWSQVCYIGDDIVDLGMLKRVGLAVVVPDAIAEVKALAHYETKAAGGRGAVREVAELILKAQGKWDAVIKGYMA